MKNTTFTILIVDDDENDQILIKRTFKKISTIATIQIAPHGQEAKQEKSGEQKALL